MTSEGVDFLPLVYERYSGLDTKYIAVLNKKELNFESEDGTAQKDSMDKKFSKMFAVNFDRFPVAFCKTMDMNFPACKDLTLSRTLLTQWSEIFKIVSLFPNLQYLDISDNALEKLSELNCDEICVKNSVKTLKVNKCSLDEESIYRLLALFPNVRDLSLNANNLKSISVPSNCESLEALHLQVNNFCNFENLKSLAKLPNVKHLNVTDCNISKITISEGFERLEKLIADDNKFTKWDDISDLKKLPSLKDLVIHARLPAPSGIHVREIMVAKFSNLTFLDRLDVSPVFRRNCEYTFLRFIGALRPIPSDHKADVQRLVAAYPQFEDLLQDDDEPQMNNDTINLKFAYEDTKYEKSFDSNQELLEVIKVVCRKLKLPSRGVEVYIRRYNTAEFGEVEEHVTYLNNAISSYDLDENSMIVLKVLN